MTHSARVPVQAISMTTVEFVRIVMHNVGLVMGLLTIIVCLALEELF